MGYVIICVVGPRSVGKTSIISRFQNDFFDSKYSPSTEITYFSNTIKVNNEEKTINSVDYPGDISHANLLIGSVILVYDVTNMNSFNKLGNWINSIRNTNDKTPIYLVGNKVDLHRREVSFEVGNNYAKTMKLNGFFETSAEIDKTTATQHKIETVFKEIAKQSLTLQTSKDTQSDIVNMIFASSDENRGASKLSTFKKFFCCCFKKSEEQEPILAPMK